jgi:CheY-like chemotaxis protein
MEYLQYKERRNQERVPACILAHYASETMTLQGVLSNLSNGGIFIESRFLDPAGSKTIISFNTYSSLGILKIKGRVVHTVINASDNLKFTSGMGIHFEDLSGPRLEWVNNYCQTFKTRKRVVLIDDEAIILRSFGSLIEAAGYRPICIEPSFGYLKVIKRFQPHLIILDYMMPMLNGAELALILKDDPLTKHIPVLFLSSYLPEVLKEVVQKTGARGFITKGESPRKFLEFIQSILK